MKKIITISDALAAPVGPFSVATSYANLIFVSGQTGQDPGTGKLVSHSVEDQARQSLGNLMTAVKAAGGTSDTVLKVNCYLLTMDDFTAFNAVYKEFFSEGDFPARTCIAVSALPLGAKVEVEATAFRAAPQ